MPTVTSQEAFPASLEAWHEYLPLSITWLFLMHSTATLLLKLMSYLSELCISMSSLNQLTDMGCDPETRPSIFTSLPSMSSMCSEGFLVNTGGFLRSEIKRRKWEWWEGEQLSKTKQCPSRDVNALEERAEMAWVCPRFKYLWQWYQRNKSPSPCH